MTDAEELEALHDLIGHPGWTAFLRQIREAREMFIANLPYTITDERQLYHLRGWIECADMVLGVANDAGLILEESERAGINERSNDWH